MVQVFWRGEDREGLSNGAGGRGPGRKVERIQETKPGEIRSRYEI